MINQKDESAMTITITTTAAELAKAYFAGKVSGCVNVSAAALSSEARPIRFIAISKGAHRVTLIGQVGGRRWEQTYPQHAVRIDD